MEIEKVYEPQRFEPHWAQWWIDRGFYTANAKNPGRMFSLVIPPPNVTGILHMGHMLEHTEIDVTVRWHRMKGENTLWLPGTDHAGIATQMVVERKLAEEGIDRRALGRQEFEKRIWAWKEESGDSIKRQMIRLGASCDWSREFGFIFRQGVFQVGSNSCFYRQCFFVGHQGQRFVVILYRNRRVAAVVQ